MPISDLVIQQAAMSVGVHTKISSHIHCTPLLLSRSSQSPADNKTPQTKLYFKTENFQYTGSFKLRGALSKLSTLPTTMPVITASSGNHGIACAFAAQRTGHELTVVLPENVVQEKHSRISALGAATILTPGDAEQAEQHAIHLSQQQGMKYISPYNDPDIIAGQGTIAVELIKQLPDIDNVFISMGGGGLISGIGSVLKAHSPAIKIIGVSAVNSAALAASIEAGRVVETTHLDTLADGCAGGVCDNTITLPLASEVIDSAVYCTEDQIVEALCELAWEEKMLVEGAAALALAAYNANTSAYMGKNNVVLLCGANFDRTLISKVISPGQTFNTID